jgi:hypothetical protein
VLSYKGADSHLHDSLKSDQWYNFIRQNDLQWRSDSLEWKGHDHFHSQLPWTDYSDVDVVIALRSDLSHHYPRKPASKLINAWMAGVPAILGPEIAFRELRESELDYIEVDSLEGVMKGVKRLKENENLYMNMVRNGKKRAKKFTRKKICKYWINKIKTIKDKYASRYLSLNVPMYYKKEVNPGKIFMRPIRLFENLIGF